MASLTSLSGWLRKIIQTATAPLAEPLFDSRPASTLIRTTARRQWHRLVLSLGLSMIQAGAEGATLGVIFLAVDLLSRSQGATADLTQWSGRQLISWLPGLAELLSTVPVGMLFAILLTISVLLKLLQSLAMYYSAVNTGYFSARVNAEVTALIHHQILRLTLACASRYPVGDLTYYASGGPGAVMTQINTASSFIVNVMMVAVYISILVSLSPWLLFAAALMATALILIQRELLPRIQNRAFESTAIAVAINTKITENIQGLRLLHSSGQLEAADQNLFNQMGKLEQNIRSNAKLTSVIGPVTVFLPMAMIALIAGLSLVVFGTRDSGILPSLVTFVVALQRLNGSFGSVAANFNAMSSNSAAIHRLNTILDPGDKQFRRLGGEPFGSIDNQVTLENVSLSYSPEAAPAVSNVNLCIPCGQTVALVGASGAGKSSIADLIVGLYEPTGGRILIDDRDLCELDVTTWQQKLGVVSQDTFLFNASIAYNISFGTPGASPEAIEQAARKAQAHAFIMGMPSGYDTLIGERGYRLSGGQRQRISLARAILRNPELLILDEATSALDSQSERLVQEAIEQFERQHTVLVIAHRLSTIVNADLICVMEQGRIVERGNHKDLLGLGGLYANLWQQQIQAGRSARDPNPSAIG